MVRDGGREGLHCRGEDGDEGDPQERVRQRGEGGLRPGGLSHRHTAGGLRKGGQDGERVLMKTMKRITGLVTTEYKYA